MIELYRRQSQFIIGFWIGLGLLFAAGCQNTEIEQVPQKTQSGVFTLESDQVVSTASHLTQFSKEVSRFLPSSRASVEQRLGLSVPPTRIVLCSDETDMLARAEEMFGAVPHRWSAGLAFPRARTILLPVTPSADLQALLRHELTHIALGKGSLPLWVNEGVSVAVGEGISFERSWALNEAAVTHTLLSFKKLERHFPAQGLPARVAYAQSAHFISYLMQRYGQLRFKQWLASLLAGQELSLSSRKAFQEELWSIEAEWRESLNRGTIAWLSWLAKAETLWSLSLLIFLIAGVRHLRRRSRTPSRRDERPLRIYTARPPRGSSPISMPLEMTEQGNSERDV